MVLRPPRWENRLNNSNPRVHCEGDFVYVETTEDATDGTAPVETAEGATPEALGQQAAGGLPADVLCNVLKVVPQARASSLTVSLTVSVSVVCCSGYIPSSCPMQCAPGGRLRAMTRLSGGPTARQPGASTVSRGDITTTGSETSPSLPRLVLTACQGDVPGEA